MRTDASASRRSGDVPRSVPAAQSQRTGWPRHGLAVLLYIVLTIALTWPLARHAADKIAIHRSLTILAPYYHFYLVAWHHHAMDGEAGGYWDCNVFHPHPRVLTYFESLFAPAAATWPVHRATDNATLCYNLVALSAFALNGLGAYALVLAVGLSWPVALLAGAMMAFCPYFFGEIYCLATLLLYPAGFLLASMHRMLRCPSWPSVVLAGLCGVWLVLACYQYTLFVSIFCVLWLVWFVRRMPWRRAWYKLLIVGIVCGAFVLPLLRTVKHTHEEMGFYHGPTLPMTWLRMLIPATGQWLYHDVIGIHVREHRSDLDPIVCFPGLAFGILAAVGAWAAVFGSAESDEERRRRHAARFYLVASVLAVGFAFGLWVHLGPARVPGPYALLFMTLSPFSSVRSVYRFFIVGQLFAAVLAGLGLKRCVGLASSGGGRVGIAIGIAAFALLESIWVPLEVRDAPGRPSDVHPNYLKAAEIDPNAPLIELPIPELSKSLRRAWLDALYTASTIHTWQPIVNGFASYSPGLYEQLRPVMAEFPSPTSLRYLRALGVRFVHVRGGVMPKGWREEVRRTPSLREIASEKSTVLYELRDSERVVLTDWQGKTSFRIEPEPNNPEVLRATVELRLSYSEVIPVLPGDELTRWTIVWLAGDDAEVARQDVDVRDSFWLAREANTISVVIRPPSSVDRGTKLKARAIDRKTGETIGVGDVPAP